MSSASEASSTIDTHAVPPNEAKERDAGLDIPSTESPIEEHALARPHENGTAASMPVAVKDAVDDETGEDRGQDGDEAVVEDDDEEDEEGEEEGEEEEKEKEEETDTPDVHPKADGQPEATHLTANGAPKGPEETRAADRKMEKEITETVPIAVSIESSAPSVAPDTTPPTNGNTPGGLGDVAKVEDEAAIQAHIGVGATGHHHSKHHAGPVGNSADEEESDDEDEDEESDDDEPVLKYELLQNAAQDLLRKDSASAIATSGRTIALGTHNGLVHILESTGVRRKSFRPHSASVLDICLDATADYVGTASVDGHVVIHSLSSTESYSFDMKRPMRTIALDPLFAKRNSRTFVCGGMAGTLVMHEKSWLGHKETPLNPHVSEGPIWIARWRASLIAWATDAGVRVYDTASGSLVAHVDRPPHSPRADLFRCTLHWQDDATLLVGWADYVQVMRVRTRKTDVGGVGAGVGLGAAPALFLELTSTFKLDSMVAGILPHPTNPATGLWPAPSDQRALTLSSFLVLSWTLPEDVAVALSEEATDDKRMQARREAEWPELRIISRQGEELSSDVLNVAGYKTFGCNDYVLAEALADGEEGGETRVYVVATPRNIVLVRPRSRRDHVTWLLEQRRFAEALEEVESMGIQEQGLSVTDIGEQYIKILVDEGSFEQAARLCPKVCAQDVKKWQDWMLEFGRNAHLQDIIPYVPTTSPRLEPLYYEMILGYYASRDRPALLRTIKAWPAEIYKTSTIIASVQQELDHSNLSSQESAVLLECQAELYTLNRQPGKALPFYLRLRRPVVFDLIRENNLFTDIQDQALLLIEFDQELLARSRKAKGEDPAIGQEERGTAITLLVDHTHSIPVERVVKQLEARPRYLYLYLDALFEKDPSLTAPFADDQVKLFADYSPKRLVDFLRVNNDYNLEKAYDICKEKDMVPEMVFLLGRMGNNKAALSLIIERLGDVQRAIEFAREQSDEDLWEDLLKYSESRPTFIKGLLENVGADINPIRLIRRIKNGLEIPGLKKSLVKILHDFNLQISLMEGCETIMHGDCADFAKKLHTDQTNGFFGHGGTLCQQCSLPLHQTSQSLTLLFMCRHIVHVSCVGDVEGLPRQPEPALVGLGVGSNRGMSGKLAYAQLVREKLVHGCPVCASESEGHRT